VTTDNIGDEQISTQDIAEDGVGSSELALTVRTALVNIAHGGEPAHSAARSRTI
jgi:hypothetical protein